MSDSNGLDIVGFGKVAKAVPKKTWERLTDTACKILEETISPITATTSGVGRLITAKFDKLVDAEKVLASDVLNKAKNKVEESNNTVTKNAKPKIIISTIESSGSETDILMRELWANLLANELTTGNVHPTFPDILENLSNKDAQLLVNIAQNDEKTNPIVSRVLNTVINKFFAAYPMLNPLTNDQTQTSFNHENLERLGLVRKVDDFWRLTSTGKEFMAVLNGPTPNKSHKTKQKS